MSFNLLETLKTKIGSSLAEHSASFLGEDQTNMEPAVDGTFAAILAGMIQKVSTDKGAKDLHNVLKKEEIKDFDLESIFKRSPQTVNGLVNRGTHFLPSLFPNKLRSATNEVSAESKISKINSTRLSKISTPMILSTLGQQVQEQNLSVDGLKSLLNGQKDAVKAALPDSFFDSTELSSFGWVKKEVVKNVKPKKVKKDKPSKEEKAEKAAAKAKLKAEKAAAATAATATAVEVDGAAAGGMGFLKWLIPLLAVLALVLFLAVRGCGGSGAQIANAPIIKKPAEVATAAATNIFGKVNEAAMGLLGNIKFAAGSAGEQMMAFLKNDSNTGEGRFRFRNLNFASGSANISGESGLEVDNLSSILKAYEDIKVNIEGYTDSQGKAESNQLLSQRRAEAVRTRLIEAGISESRISTKGFGAENPVATNDTAEGRAENRRIEIVIVK